VERERTKEREWNNERVREGTGGKGREVRGGGIQRSRECNEKEQSEALRGWREMGLALD